MITAKEAKACVDRLAILPSSQTDEVLAALKLEAVKAFMVNCSSRDAAERLVARILQRCKWFPTPSEIGEIASEPQYESHARGSCSVCGGTGFSPAYGVPSGKGRVSRLDVEQLRAQLGDHGYFERRGAMVPKPAQEVVYEWARRNRREVVEVSEVCICVRVAGSVAA